MKPLSMLVARGLALFMLLLAGLLDGAGHARAADEMPAVIVERPEELPAGVQRMREAILAAAASGDIANLREALEMNELMPLIDGAKPQDPIKAWQAASVDGSGRDVLALLWDMLLLPPAKISRANSVRYVWPYFAELPLDGLRPREIVSLYRLAPAAEVALMLEQRRYSFYRLTMGEDGTWHSLDRLSGK